MSGAPARGRLRAVLFRAHWMLGISAGLVLAIVGASGAALAFEDEIVAALNPAHRLVPEGERLGPDALVANVRAAHPDFEVRGIAIPLAAPAPAEVRVARAGERGGVAIAVDPWRGTVLGEPVGASLLHIVEMLHRNLLAAEAGKRLVGASVVALVVMLVTGLVLRWPWRARSPRAWLVPDARLRGRGRWFNLHAVLATWMLPLYLVSALTGLWWSYAFYRNAINTLAGLPPQPPRPAAAAAPPPVTVPPLDRAWRTFLDEAPDATHVVVSFGPDPAAPLDWRYLARNALHARAFDTLKIDPASGAVVARDAYATQPRGRRFVSAILPLHTGAYFGWPGRLAMATAALAMPFFAATGLWLWVLRRRMRAVAHGSSYPSRNSKSAATTACETLVVDAVNSASPP